MKAIMKLAYYRSAQMKPDLARRYYRLLPPTGRILDVGCGVGGFGALNPGGREVHGIDIDAGAVAKAQEHELARQHDLASSTLPYEDAFFDGVLAKDILEHLTDPAAIVREIERVLRPGGVVVASVVMAKPKAVWADYTHVRGFTKASASLLFEDAGFDVQDVWPMGGVPLSNRLHFMGLVPTILRIPGLGALWASSWELRARR
jgi:2-polyprenyl-3-methyl-5-hydroxy-6-metoxy-1,4-benzoquinol methylase